MQRKRERVEQSFITHSYLHKQIILQYVHYISTTSPYVINKHGHYEQHCHPQTMIIVRIIVIMMQTQ